METGTVLSVREDMVTWRCDRSGEVHTDRMSELQIINEIKRMSGPRPMKHSMKQSITSERNRAQHIQQLYPDTHGRQITHTSSRTDSRNCGMFTDAVSCVDSGN